MNYEIYTSKCNNPARNIFVYGIDNFGDNRSKSLIVNNDSYIK